MVENYKMDNKVSSKQIELEESAVYDNNCVFYNYNSDVALLG